MGAPTKAHCQAAADVFTAAGIATLGSDPPADAVFYALERLGNLLVGADPLLRETCRSAVIGTLRLAGVYGPARLVDAALRSTPKAADETEYHTFGPAGDATVIDLVQSGRRLKWVLARPGKIEIVERVEGRASWPRAVLPWAAIPLAEDVRNALDRGARPPFHDLADLYKARVVLPEPREPWAGLLAAWAMGTYLLDRFNYFPLILLEGPAERGKTRLGKALVWTAHRGMFTPSPTPATLFRDRARHRVALFLDVTDLPSMFKRGGDLVDLVLNSFEQDGVVRRVTRMDAPPQEQVETFATYGPTILASNRAIAEDSPLASRCIRVPLPEAGRVDVPEALKATEALPLRAEAVAWAAQLVADGTELPQIQGALSEFHGRLRDLATPPLRTTGLVQPEAVPVQARVLGQTDQERRGEVSGSRDARVAVAMWELREYVKDGQLAVAIVQEHLNRDASEGEQTSAQAVGHARRNLGLRGRVGGPRGTAHIIWPGDEQAKALYDRYVR